MQKPFSDMIQEIYSERFKSLGWRKQGQNFRFIQDDGLGKIINFQKSKWNTKEEVTFFINYGIYIEAKDNSDNYFIKLPVKTVCFGLHSDKDDNYIDSIKMVIEYNKKHNNIEIKKLKMSPAKIELLYDKQFNPELEIKKLKNKNNSY